MVRKMNKKNPKSKIVVYIHRTKRMVEKGKNKFLKQERPRIEVSLPGQKPQFMYADEFATYIINNFKYVGEKDE